MYQFFGSLEGEPRLEDYRPTWLPNGYNEKKTITMDDQVVIEYCNVKGEAIYFKSMKLDTFAQEEIILDGMAAPVDIAVNGLPGKYYQAKDVAQSNVIVWFDEKHGAILSMHSYLEKSIILRIAESVSLDDVTN